MLASARAAAEEIDAAIPGDPDRAAAARLILASDLPEADTGATQLAAAVVAAGVLASVPEARVWFSSRRSRRWRRG